MNAAKKLLDVLLGKEVKQLSPATQAVYEAAIEQATFPDDAEWAVIYALRAAADQVVPQAAISPQKDLDSRREAMEWGMANQAQLTRQQLLAIATELEETQ
jgi:hypothetical protein